MNKIIPVLLFFCFGTQVAFSQKSKVRAAYNYFKEPYQEYDKAKEAIDEATLNDQSKGLVDTWFYRGLIYNAIFNSEKYKSLCSGCLEISYEAFRKAMEIDPKNEWADEITTFRMPLVLNAIFSEGVREFGEQKFKDALASFEFVSKHSPNDSTAILNSALAAERAGETNKAIQYYRTLTEARYNDPNIYVALSNLYKQEKDTNNALTVIQSGRTIYPDTLSLILVEINLLLATGRNEESIAALENAIQKDPKNIDLYLALGSTYDGIGNPRDEKGNDLPKPANSAEMTAKAEQAYKKGLEIVPNSFEINYNLGAMYFNEAAELANAANLIESNTEHEKAKIAYEAAFRKAAPYLEKALESNPNDMSTLTSLREVYARTNQTEKYNAIKARIDSIK